MIRTSPIHHLHVASGAELVEFGGWQIGTKIPQSAEPILTDQSHDGKIHVEGEKLDELFINEFAVSPPEIGDALLFKSAVDPNYFLGIGQLTPTRYLLITPPGAEADIIAKLEAAKGDQFITITDQTNGQGGIYFAGENSAELLSHLCGLDFSPRGFPVSSVKRSSLAKIRVTIWHLEDGWHIYAARSYMEYLWNTLQETKRLIAQN